MPFKIYLNKFLSTIIIFRFNFLNININDIAKTLILKLNYKKNCLNYRKK